ncbi:MAG: tRNA dihydrouridine synthase DusB [bacterium]|nr:tRNA dihydrouridine synthase DusB [bacterium]
MYIGNYKIIHPFILAPMAGYTDLPFRLLCRKYGATLAYTEMVSAAGLVREHRKTNELLRSSPEDKPLAVQLFGNEPNILGKAAKLAVAYGADFIDLNCGCAVKKVVKQGAGSALLQSSELLLKLATALVDSVPVPVTVKLRSGWDDHSDELGELTQRLEQVGIKAISLHPRTAQQGFRGNADWSVIKKIKRHLSIPVIGSGDVKTAADAIKMLNETKCDAVMFARGALGHPWIFAEAIKLYNPSADLIFPVPQNREEQKQIIIEHFKAIVDFYGEQRGIRIFRAHACYYVKGWKDATQLRNRINQLNTIQEVISIIAEAW